MHKLFMHMLANFPCLFVDFWLDDGPSTTVSVGTPACTEVRVSSSKVCNGGSDYQLHVSVFS